MRNYEELTFADDFMFCKILTQDEELCKELVELITDRKISRIVGLEGQRSIKPTADGKGVRFDVYFVDQDDVAYDIEMQTVRSRNLPKRSRYYQGMIDLNIIEPGDDYNKLKESYVIFICPFDAFGYGLHRYTFEYLCRQDPSIALNDGTRKIFLCAGSDADDVSPELGNFLNYIAGRGSSGRFISRLETAVEKARRHDEWRLEFMTLEMKYREQREEGRKEGVKEGFLNALTLLINKGMLSKADAAAAAGISLQELETSLAEEKK